MYDLEQRQLMIRYALEGKSTWQIAKIMNCSPSTVSNIAGKKGAGALNPEKRCTRLLTERDHRHIHRLIVKNDCQSCSQIAYHVAEYLKKPVSKSTIRRTLLEMGMVSRVKVPKPFLSTEHMEKRLAFARAHLTWTVMDWRQVVFADECCVQLVPKYRTLHWIEGGSLEILTADNTVPYMQAGGGSCMVWGCITSDGVGEISNDTSTITSKRYCAIISHELRRTIKKFDFDPERLWFAHDNARVHKTKEVQDRLSELHVNVMDWPPYSPDINPIENIWAILKRRLRCYDEEADCHQTLWQRIVRIWFDITADELAPYYASMPERMQAIVDAGGGPIKY